MTNGAGRFDYVQYDEQAIAKQLRFKTAVEALEAMIKEEFTPGRAPALALTSLEEFYMWVGKATRDDQLIRNGSAPLQEERCNIVAAEAPPANNNVVEQSGD